MTGTASFAAVALEDGSLVVYSPNGRRYVLGNTHQTHI